MMRLFLTLCLFLTCIALADARPQHKPRPNLSGTWIAEADSKRDKKLESSSGTTVVIEHQDPEFAVVRIDEVDGQKRERKLIYYTDKSGETNLLPDVAGASRKSRTESLKSKTSWEGDKVVTRVDILKVTSGQRAMMEIIYEWKLSHDGQTLTETTIIKSNDRATGLPNQGIGRIVGRGEMRRTLKRVYRRGSS